MKNYFNVLVILAFFSCSKSNVNTLTITDARAVFIEHFDSQLHLNEFWEDASQNSSPMNYSIDNGHLKIITRAHEVDRVKIKTIKEDFGLGTYTWRIYTSERIMGDQNSIGAFLYSDDNHEIDFEIGSGNTNVRNTLNAQANDLVAYCTSQNFPFISSPFLIKHNQWHTFSITLLQEHANGNYTVQWFIDTVLLQTVELEYSPETTFGVYCSLENLRFIGDQLPRQAYSVSFDSFMYKE